MFQEGKEGLFFFRPRQVDAGAMNGGPQRFADRSEDFLTESLCVKSVRLAVWRKTAWEKGWLEAASGGLGGGG